MKLHRLFAARLVRVVNHSEGTEERATLLKMADDLIDKLKEIKQKKATPAP